MTDWIIEPKQSPPPALTSEFPDQQFLAQLLTQRGYTDLKRVQAFLDPSHYQPASPYDLPDMILAVDRIEEAVENQEKIAVWGDFDVDGQSSTALLIDTLTLLGASVTYHIPHREHEGHGIHISGLQTLKQQGVSLLITCDTGITAHTAIDYANSQNMAVIVTDHHQLAQILPNAFANINPQRLPETHPLHPLPGVGCAYKLAEALFERFDKTQHLQLLLDLVALGIVADVAVLKDDARYLLHWGLKALRSTQRIGLLKLIEVADLTQDLLDETDIGFSIGPRLNAVGRLSDASLAVELLITTDPERAHILTNQIEGLNAQRKMLTQQIYRAAVERIENDVSLRDTPALIIYGKEWPGGILGIVANYLTETYNKPTILLSGPDSGFLRGSARSVEGLDITQAISQHRDLINTFGGHTMAAGLSLVEENLSEFRRKFNVSVRRLRQDTESVLAIDALVKLSDLDDNLVQTLDLLSPFGPGNPPITLLSTQLTIHDQKQLGRAGDHLRLVVGDEDGVLRDVIWWRAQPEALPPGRIDLVYRPTMNTYKGERRLQLELVDFRPIDEEPTTYAHRAEIEVIDLRDRPTDFDAFSTLNDSIIWAEAGTLKDGVSRMELTKHHTFLIWTSPPGPDELHEALEAVNPAVIYLLGFDTGTDAVQAFLQRLGGLVKHTINQQSGITSHIALAGAMGQRIATIKIGLEWMTAHRQISVMESGPDEGEIHLQFTPGTTSNLGGSDATTRLAAALRETAAYRAYFRKANPEALLGTGSVLRYSTGDET